MALLSTIDYEPDHTNGVDVREGIGPVHLIGSTYYAVGVDDANNAILRLWSSTDPSTGSWSSAFSKTYTGESLTHIDSFYDGTDLHVVVGANGSDTIWYLRIGGFGGTISEEEDTQVATNVNEIRLHMAWQGAICVTTNGDIYITCPRNTDNEMGAKMRSVYFRSTNAGVSFASAVDLHDSSNAGAHYTAAKVFESINVANAAHFVYCTDANATHGRLQGRTLRSGTLTPANTAPGRIFGSPFEQVSSGNSNTGAQGGGLPFQYNDGTNDLVSCCVADHSTSDGTIVEVYVTEDGNGDLSETSRGQKTVSTTVAQGMKVLQAKAPNGKLYALAGQNSTLGNSYTMEYWEADGAGGAWGSDQTFETVTYAFQKCVVVDRASYYRLAACLVQSTSTNTGYRDVQLDASGGAEVSPEQAVLAWVAQNATTTAGGVTANPSQAVLAWVAQDATAAIGGAEVSPEQAVLAWTAQDVTTNTTVSVSPEQAVLTWVASDVTTIAEVAPEQATLAWVAQDATTTTTVSVSPDQATLAWVAQDTTTNTTVSVSPEQAVLAWVAQDTQTDQSNFPQQATLAWVAQNVLTNAEVAPQQAVLAWVAQDTTADVGISVNPQQAVLAWVAQNAISDVEVAPAQAVLAWTATDVLTTVEVAVEQAVLAWTAQDVTDVDLANYPQQAVLPWVAQDVVSDIEVSPDQAILTWAAQDVQTDQAPYPQQAVLSWVAQDVLATVEVAPAQAILAWVAQDITDVGVGPRPTAATLAWVANDVTDIDLSNFPQAATLAWVAQNVTTGTGISVSPQQAVLSWVAQNVLADVEVAPSQASLSWVASDVLATVEVAPTQAVLAWTALDVQTDQAPYPQQATLTWVAQDTTATPGAATASPEQAALVWVAQDVTTSGVVSPEQATLAWVANDTTTSSTVSVSPQQASLIWVAQDTTSYTTTLVSPEQAVLIWQAQNVLSDVVVSPEGALLNWVAQDVSSLISGLDADGEITDYSDRTGGSLSFEEKGGGIAFSDRTTSTITPSQ